ncbi:MAG: hypothetical protein NTY48_00275 [Candidatus Diapherotrites archaeon]|nr:hypothetical protein [Candidatus Diapherotrites archaeon]
MNKYILDLINMVGKEFDFIDFWAHKCRQNMNACLAETTPFINAQIATANKFYLKLSKTPQGRKKIQKLKMQ